MGAKLDMQLPTEADPVHKAKLAILKTLSGYEFDTTYINSQVMDHYATIALFENEISGGRNPLVKNYANKTLPHLKMHLEEALAIQARLE